MAPILALENISKRFGAVVVADGIDLALAEGEALGIIGPNGAGKTTLFGPMMPSASPSASARSTLSATTTAPNRFEIFSSARIGAMGLRQEIGCSLPPSGMFGAVLFSAITRSNLPFLRCHWPATSGVLVTFLTGWPVHWIGPTIDW